MGKKEKVRPRKKVTSCGAVTWRLREGKVEVLLIKQFAHKERWGIPKGHVDKGETEEICAIREVREETGVNITLGNRLPDAYITNDTEEKTVVSWLAQAVGNDEPAHDDPDSEVADARWFDVAELPEIMVYQRSLLSHAVATLSASLDKPAH